MSARRNDANGSSRAPGFREEASRLEGAYQADRIGERSTMGL